MDEKRANRTTGSNLAILDNCITEVRADGVIWTRLTEYVSGQNMASTHRSVIRLIREETPKLWFADATKLTGFEAQGLGKPAGSFLEDLKERGFVLVGLIGDAAFGMLFRSICFGSGIRSVVVERGLDADRQISYFLEKGELDR